MGAGVGHTPLVAVARRDLFWPTRIEIPTLCAAWQMCWCEKAQTQSHSGTLDGPPVRCMGHRKCAAAEKSQHV